MSAKPKRFAWALGLAMASAMTAITNSGAADPAFEICAHGACGRDGPR